MSDLPQGKSGSLTFQSSPGNYRLICNQPNHYKAGMWTKLTVNLMTRAFTLPRGVRAARLTAGGSMSMSDWMALAAAGSGLVGTVIIFARSYALPPSGLSGLLVRSTH